MTNREFFNGIINGFVVLNAGKENETEVNIFGENGFDLTDEMKDFARAAIAKLDAKNSAAKAKPKKANEANETLKDFLFDNMKHDTIYTAKWAADYLNDNIDHEDPFTTQKTSALLRQMVAEGKLIEREVKKGKTKEYELNVDKNDD